MNIGVKLDRNNIRLKNEFMGNSKLRNKDGNIKLDNEERCDINVIYNFNKSNMKYDTSNFYNTYISPGGLFIMRDADEIIKDHIQFYYIIFSYRTYEYNI